MANVQPIELTMILVPDQNTGQFTAFFAEFPEAIAIGDDQKDAEKRLLNIFTIMMNDKKNTVIQQHINGAEYISKSANLTFA